MTDKIATAYAETWQLWQFYVEAIDLRTGETVSGLCVTRGNEDYETEAAIRDIARQWGRLGYDVQQAEFKGEKVITLNAALLFAAMPQAANVPELPEETVKAQTKDEDEIELYNEITKQALAELEK